MASIQSFDKLNIVQKRAIPYDEYFGDMELTKEQKARRKDLAFILEDVIAIWFTLVEDRYEMDTLDEAREKQQLTYMIYEAIDGKGYFASEAEQDKYVKDFVKNTYATTVERLESEDVAEAIEVVPKKGVTEPTSVDDVERYWVSEDRAEFIAENEANTIINTAEFIEAKKAGKTHKIWMAYPDDRVRPTHEVTNGAKIPIDAYFDVGAARMLYPKDVTSELSTGADYPEETINCRCSISYV